MSIITELTKEQIDLQKVYRDKWIDIGLNTNPADRKKAEECIKLMYNKAKIKEPKIIWCDSPLTACLTKYTLERDSVRASVGVSVWETLWESDIYNVSLYVGECN